LKKSSLVYEAIILAGGKGTRLRSVVSDMPKPMADISGKPFLYYLLKYLSDNHISRVILSVGYKHEEIINYFGDSFLNLELVYALEENALGTGGAVKNAIKYAKSQHVLVLNGDTYSNTSINKLLYNYNIFNPDVLILARPIVDNMRYDTFSLDINYRICESNSSESLINSGMYLINVQWYINTFQSDTIFSLEKKLFGMSNNFNMIGVPDNNYFIDIGIPEDYAKSNISLLNNLFNPIKVKSNTLFLDRDGVINRKIDNGYVTEWKEFKLIKNVKSSLKVLSKKFK